MRTKSNIILSLEFKIRICLPQIQFRLCELGGHNIAWNLLHGNQSLRFDFKSFYAYLCPPSVHTDFVFINIFSYIHRFVNIQYHI